MADPAVKLGTGKSITPEHVKEFEEQLKQAVNTVNNILNGGSIDELALDTAVITIDRAFSRGSAELYNLLKIGEVIKERHAIEDVLAEGMPKRIKLLSANREKLDLVLKKTQEYIASQGRQKPELKIVPPTEEQKRELLESKVRLLKDMQSDQYGHLAYPGIIKALREMAEGKDNKDKMNYPGWEKEDFYQLLVELGEEKAKLKPKEPATTPKSAETGAPETAETGAPSEPEVPAVETPKAETKKPKGMPIVLHKVLETQSAEEVNIFKKAWAINRGAENELDSKQLNILKIRMSGIETAAKEDTPESRAAIVGWIKQIVKQLGGQLGEAPSVQEKPEDADMRSLLDNIVDKPEFSEKLNKVFDFKTLDHEKVANKKESYEIKKIQQEIDIVIYTEIIDLYKIIGEAKEEVKEGGKKEIKNDEKVKLLEMVRLTEQRGEDKIKGITTNIDKLLELITKFEAKQAERKKKERAEAEGDKEEEELPKTPERKKPKIKEEEGVPPPPPAEGGGKTKETPRKEGETKKEEGEAAEKPGEKEGKDATEKAPESLDGEIQKMMAEVLVDKSLYNTTGSPKDRASLAIRALINTEMHKKESDFTLIGLKGFLMKPNLTLTEAVNEYIGKSALKLQVDLKEAEREIKNINDNISTQKSRLGGGYNKKTAQDEQDVMNAIKGLQKDLREKEDEKDAITTAIAYKTGTMRYNSTEQVLAMVNVYLNMKLGQEKISEKDFMKIVKKQIDDQNVNAHGKGGKWVNAAFGVLTGFGILKPGLKSTLKNLEKDELLKKIGAEKFAKLSDAWDSKGNVEAWVQSLEGGTDQVMTTYVPRIIAYLQMAIRDGNMTYMRLDSTYRAKKLLDHLTSIRHNYVIDKVEKNSQNLSDADRMAMYFKELDKLSVSTSKLTRKLISRRAGLRALIGAGTVGAGAAALLLGGALGAVGLVGAGVTGKLGHSAITAKTPEQKAMYKKLAVRTGLASGIGIAAAAVSPWLIPLALTGVLGPELWKNKKNIVTSGPARFLGRTASWGVKSALTIGLTGGLALFFKGGRNIVFGGLKNVFSPGTPKT